MSVYVCSARLSYRTIQSKRQQHHKEDQGPERRAGHGRDGRRVHHEHEPWPFRGHILDFPAGRVGHVAQHAEDDEASDEGRGRVDNAGEDSVPVGQKCCVISVIP